MYLALRGKFPAAFRPGKQAKGEDEGGDAEDEGGEEEEEVQEKECAKCNGTGRCKDTSCKKRRRRTSSHKSSAPDANQNASESEDDYEVEGAPARQRIKQEPVESVSASANAAGGKVVCEIDLTNDE